MADIQYDPACMDCRRDNGKDLAGTTWQCAGHVRAERDWLRAKLANVMVEWEHDVEVLTKERNAALKLSEQRGAAYDMTWREVESLREWKDKLEAERDDIAAWAESWMKRAAAAERERDEARAAALVAVEERRSFQKAHDLSERHRGPLERVRSAAYDLFQALDWEAPGWRDETCAERGDATNKAWFELEAALNFAAECDSSHSRPAPPAPRGEFAIIASLVAAMKRWGSEEDGVPDFAWKAYTAGAAYIVTPPPPSDNKGCAA